MNARKWRRAAAAVTRRRTIAAIAEERLRLLPDPADQGGTDRRWRRRPWALTLFLLLSTHSGKTIAAIRAGAAATVAGATIGLIVALASSSVPTVVNALLASNAGLIVRTPHWTAHYDRWLLMQRKVATALLLLLPPLPPVKSPMRKRKRPLVRTAAVDLVDDQQHYYIYVYRRKTAFAIGNWRGTSARAVRSKVGRVAVYKKYAASTRSLRYSISYALC